MTSDATLTSSPAALRALDSAVDTLLTLDPGAATEAGDHRYDACLPDVSPEGLESARRALRAELDRVVGVDPATLAAEDRVDRDVLVTGLRSRLFVAEELRPYATDPLAANPGRALRLLLARDFAPLPDRLADLAGRLNAVPPLLAHARRALAPCSRVALETAVGQFGGTLALVDREVAAALELAPGMRDVVAPARAGALGALEEHLAFLRARLGELAPGDEGADPRLGPDRFAARLALSLDLGGEVTPDDVLRDAERHLLEVEEELEEVAAALGARPGPDGVREVLDRVADESPVDDRSVLPLCRDALESTTAYVRDARLLTVHDDPVEVVVMPEIDRGVAVAYCDPPGPLETAPLPTWFAVSPTPADWPDERVRSFYREYNAAMLQNLAVHEASPGHVQQLAHSRRFRGATRVRALLWNGAFVEGWAVYAEELMVRRGYEGTGGVRGAAALRLQQLKMQLRSTINAILDVRVHAHGMTREEAMRLMTGRGHQEEGEAHGKWRRALLTSGQLSTYFVGYRQVADLAADLRAVHPGWGDREVHDALLAHGSPAPRHVRALLIDGSARR